MSGFYSLQIAKTALYATQKAIEVTGHNITNANTPGYTRQRVELSAIPSSGKDMLMTSTMKNAGGGVNVVEITRLRDKYIDIKYRKESSLKSELEIENDSYKHLEGIFKEPSDHGIHSALSEFFNSFDDLNSNAHEIMFRDMTVQSASKLTNAFNSTAREMIGFRQETNRNISLIVDEMNNTAAKIASLNDRIRYFESTGKMANDLRDERDLLIDQMSDFVNITVSEYDNGPVRISIGGMDIVDGSVVNELVAKPDSVCKYSGDNLYGIYWENGGNEVNIKSGKLKGMLDIRDGDHVNEKGIPYFLDRLDMLAATIVEKFNQVNRTGYTIPFNDNLSMTGTDFFNPDCTTAATICVSDALLESGYNIAASDSPVLENHEWGNNKNVSGYFDIISSKGLSTGGVAVGGIRTFYEQTLFDLSMVTGLSGSKLNSQDALVNFIQNEKLTISEVSMDEEIMDLVRYQHAYSAAAQYISVINKLTEELINIVR